MYWSGHYGVALLAYAPVLYVFASQGEMVTGVAGGVLVLALSTLPDVDHQIPLVAHRSVTHTLAFAAFVGAVVGGAVWFAPVAGEPREILAYGAGGLAAFAIVAHLLADALTPMGVPLLWPLTRRRYSLGVTPAGNVFWNGGLLVLGVFANVVAVLSIYNIY